jgi:hypothetical protein
MTIIGRFFTGHLGRLSWEWHIAHVKGNSRSFHFHVWLRTKGSR